MISVAPVSAQHSISDELKNAICEDIALRAAAAAELSSVERNLAEAVRADARR